MKEFSEVLDDARQVGGPLTVTTQDENEETGAPRPEDMRRGMCDILRQWELDSYLTAWHLGTEKFTSKGEFIYTEARGRDAEREVIMFANRFDVSRDVWFFNALLMAALGHVYMWIRREPRKIREVLDPRILNDLRESLRFPMDLKAERTGPSHRDMYQKIDQIPIVPVEDVGKGSNNQTDQWEHIGQCWANWQDSHNSE